MNAATPRILKLIDRYISKDLNEKDFNELKQWLAEDSKHHEFFINNLKTYKESRSNQFYKILDKNNAWNTILSKLKNPLPQNSTSRVKYLKQTRVILKYVAVLIIFLTAAFIYNTGHFSKTKKSTITPEGITLLLENGDIKIINTDGSTQLVDTKGNPIGEQQGNQIKYSNSSNKETLVYNTLTVPSGKQFEIQLSDGTHVHLNSGTSLKYPVEFIEGKSRKVFLTGEAFFSVTKDVKHPFIVNIDNLDVKVLGTKFNVSAYPEDTTTDVVLVEGLVEMNKNAEGSKSGVMLAPNTKGSLNKIDAQITTSNVNTSNYTSWMQGELLFRNISFETIAKKLERRYNKKIVITNPKLKNEIFNANFKDESLENILSYFIDSYNIQYKIIDHIIYIN